MHRFKFVLQFQHALRHPQNDLNPGQIHSEIVHQRFDPSQDFDIPFRIQADIPLGAGRFDNTHSFIIAQGMGLYPNQPGRDTDDVARLVIVYISSLQTLTSQCSSANESSVFQLKTN